MPAGSSDGSLSSATRASRPVLTTGRARGPDAQRATVWSKNGSAKRSADRSAQSTAGAGPEKSSLTGVQRARSASSISVLKSDKESAHNQRPDQLDLLLRPQLGQVANPKGLGASRDECHRGFVIGSGAYRQTRKLQRYAAFYIFHPGKERLVLPHECLSVDSDAV